MKTNIKKFIAVALVMVFLLSPHGLLEVFAFDFSKSYKETYDVKKIYCTVHDDIPVRKSPSKYSAPVMYWDSDLFVEGTIVENNKTHNRWLKVTLDNNSEVFVFMGHLVEHKHSYIPIGIIQDSLNPNRYSEFQVCDCGLQRSLRWNGSEYTSCRENQLICQWITGENNSFVKLFDFAVEGMVDAGIVLTCNPEAIVATEGGSGAACAALVLFSNAKAVIDLKTNVSKENYTDVVFNVADIMVGLGDLLEISEINSAVKNSSLYKNSKYTSDFSTKKELLKAVGESVRKFFSPKGEMVFHPYEDLCPAEATTENYISGPTGTLKMGQPYSLEGFVREGDYPLVSVTTKIKDYYGNELYSYSDAVDGSYYFHNSNCDRAMLFNRLCVEGRYQYEVYVTEYKCGHELTNLVFRSWFNIVP